MFSSLESLPFFSKSYVFNNTLGVRDDLITSTVFVKATCGPLEIVA